MNTTDLLKELIRIDSTTPGEINRAIRLAAEHLRRAGIQGEILEYEGLESYVAVVGEGEKCLVLNGHLDVVSGKPLQFEPHESEGRLYGRGSVDMKAGCVAMIGALVRLQKEQLSHRVMLQLVPDEEVGGRRGTGFLVQQGYTGDFVICTEPTNLAISIQSKGILLLDIEVSGRSAHGSRPWEGENAILRGMDIFRRIEALPVLNRSSRFYDKSSINLAKIRGGDIYNRVPDRCTLGIDIRYVPDIDPDEILEAIDVVTEGRITVKAKEHGVNVGFEDSRVRDLQASLSRIVPTRKTELAAAHGGADTRYFAALGIPAVEFGPCGANWHGEEEYVELQSVQELEDILVDFALGFR